MKNSRIFTISRVGANGISRIDVHISMILDVENLCDDMRLVVFDEGK